MYGLADGTNSYGVYGKATASGSTAGYFDGAAEITGGLVCSGGATFNGNATFNNSVTIEGNLTVYGSCSGCSDLRMKQNVKPLTGGLDRLLELREVTFEWIDPTKDHHERETGTQFGFIAQDLEKLHPQWVNPEGYKRKDGETFRTIDLHEIEALEVGGIRQLKTENDALKARADKDETIIKDQGERIARLEKLAGLSQVSWYERNQTLLTALMGLGLVGGFAGFSRLRRKHEHEKRS